MAFPLLIQLWTVISRKYTWAADRYVGSHTKPLKLLGPSVQLCYVATSTTQQLWREGAVGKRLTVPGSNPAGGQIFCTLPHHLLGPPSLLCQGYRLYFPGLKRPGRGVDRSKPSSADVKDECVQLRLYCPSAPS